MHLTDRPTGWPGWRRRGLLGLASAALLAGGNPAAIASPAARAVAPGGVEHVVVTGMDGAGRTIETAIRALGGRVTRSLPLIGGAAATLPVEAETALRAVPGVRTVSPDAAGHLLSVDPALGYDPAADDGSMSVIDKAIGATTSWQRGYTGKGVDVALIDSGVSPVQGLTSGNVINGPDLSFDSQNADLSDLDGFGHGTHMASIIAGRDRASTPAGYVAAGSSYVGVAPDARLVSVKVAAADGAADVSQVIAAINWVDQHAHTDGLNIRVLNLSYGTNSAQPASSDPLAYACEQAWRHGIVVVVSGGNDGSSTYTLADPAYDPYVLAVGAEDPHSTTSATDDTVTPFTTRGTNTRHVDLVAPGIHVLGLRDPGSAIDTANPSAVVGGRFFRGSGTSQSAAVVSGAAALLLQRYPNATPDAVKRQLMSTASAFSSATNIYRGNGLVNVALAESNTLNASTQPADFYSTGTGSLDAVRGGQYLQDDQGNILQGERDIFGRNWVPAQWTADTTARRTWGSDGSWNGSSWAGTAFDAHGWTGTDWASHHWTASNWAGQDWSSHHWTSHHWTASGWDSINWSDDNWTSHHWTANTWSSASWS